MSGSWNHSVFPLGESKVLPSSSQQGKQEYLQVPFRQWFWDLFEQNSEDEWLPWQSGGSNTEFPLPGSQLPLPGWGTNILAWKWPKNRKKTKPKATKGECAAVGQSRTNMTRIRCQPTSPPRVPLETFAFWPEPHILTCRNSYFVCP